ncbi:hypothetical protein B1759_18050 [Rubrivirga sp. SAORIC476]|nr:hypothetical protein B1759_18050 [Rubrivirga sp. SAORIC476]
MDRLVAQDTLWADALRIHYDAVVLDGHIDTPTLMLDRGYALGQRHRGDHVDLPRMAAGGLDGAFFSIYVARSYGEGQAATDRALAMIERVNQQVAGLEGAMLVRTADGVLRARERGQAAVLLGLEGGHALQGSPDVLRLLAANGVRYVTLTHTNTNAWADASTDAPRWGGLNALGREMVTEMNRLGVLVDLSHVSDDTIRDALAATRAPVIVSHSSCRALHDHARNVSDDLLRAIAANDGVVMINFYPLYLGSGAVTVETLLDHIEHAVAVAGADHVGIGSDFDGVTSLPSGMGDVTRLPWLTYGLLQRGVSEADVRKILGGNVLRVMREAERVAADMRTEGTASN